jgi:hypothetical protein
MRGNAVAAHDPSVGCAFQTSQTVPRTGWGGTLGRSDKGLMESALEPSQERWDVGRPDRLVFPIYAKPPPV